MAAANTAGKNVPNLVVVHPLVLLSAVDHYNRVAKDTARRVVGILLGHNAKGRVEVTNSYAGMISSSLLEVLRTGRDC